MENLDKTVEDWLKDQLDEEHFLVEMKVTAKGNNQKVLIILDGDKGVSIDLCASLSRRLSAYLETEGWPIERIELEISSPGLDKPLKNQRQYHKNIGRKVKIRPIEGKEISGELVSVNKEFIEIEKKVKKEIKNQKILWNEIKSTIVIPSFK
jgi:ribosome maturation factor RimP